jgi:hypothetical protein
MLMLMLMMRKAEGITAELHQALVAAEKGNERFRCHIIPAGAEETRIGYQSCRHNTTFQVPRASRPCLPPIFNAISPFDSFE